MDKVNGKVGSKSSLMLNSAGNKESDEDDISGDEVDKKNRKMIGNLKNSQCCTIF